MPWSTARAMARSWSAAAPLVISPPTAPAPKPRTEISRPVRPSLRRSIPALLFIQGREGGLFLGHVPEHRGRRGDQPIDVRAQCGRLVELAEVDVGRRFDPVLLQRHRDLLLPGRIALPGKGIAQFLDLRIARPAIRGLVT